MARLIGLITAMLLLITASKSSAQIVINEYAAVTGFLPCDNIITVDTADSFSVGDNVLMIQMKGAVIDSSNTPSFGTVLDYRGAGNYEYNRIKSINGNSITLLYAIIREYNIPDGKVQLVKVPVYQNYTVNQPHTSMAWNGTKGGVFAIKANTLTLNDSINVSGKGFKGGVNTPTFSAPVICNINAFYLPPNIDSGGMKGEGIANIATSKLYGMGKLANGGGGGNAHNGGGGGGSNGVAGGIGGSQFYGCNSNPAANTSAGRAGVPLPYSNIINKIFLGGGGGSSQSNNNTTATGGNGGGICFIEANILTGNAGYIAANGTNASECTNNGTYGVCHDGMAGGGAGGTILLNVFNAIGGTINANVRGGKGGDVASAAVYDQVGPGGGGSGGIVWLQSPSVPANLVITNTGGINGKVLYNNTNWGAAPGQPGQTLTGLNVENPSDTFKANLLTAAFSDSVMSCYTRKFKDSSSSLSGNINSWLWLFPGNVSSSLQNPTFTFSGYGTFQVTLVVMNDNGCTDSVTQNVVIDFVPFAQAGNDTTSCDGKTILLSASGGLVYLWSPPDGLSNPSSPTTDAIVHNTTDYIVTVINDIGCIDSDTVKVTVSSGPSLSITSENNNITCENRSIQLNASGANLYSWSPGIFCNDSTSATPIVSPQQTTTFTVTGTDNYGCTAEDTITIVTYNGESRLFMPNAFSPNNDGNNDEIGPTILCDFELEQFAIFNRWGQRVFNTSKVGEGWNGSFKNKQADLGSYFYFIKGKKANGSSITIKGDITLMR